MTLLVSHQKLRQQAAGITLVRQERESGNQTLGFATRLFVCGLLVKRPSQSDLLYERRDGFFTLQITGVS
jgi:hypothetical protein